MDGVGGVARLPVEGFLKKKGEKGAVKTWKQRWFSLDATTGHLNYYHKKGEKSPLGFIDLSKVMSFVQDDDKGFIIITPLRNWALQAEENYVMLRWLDQLEECRKELLEGGGARDVGVAQVDGEGGLASEAAAETDAAAADLTEGADPAMQALLEGLSGGGGDAERLHAAATKNKESDDDVAAASGEQGASAVAASIKVSSSRDSDGNVMASGLDDDTGSDLWAAQAVPLRAFCDATGPSVSADASGTNGAAQRPAHSLEPAAPTPWVAGAAAAPSPAASTAVVPSGDPVVEGLLRDEIRSAAEEIRIKDAIIALLQSKLAKGSQRGGGGNNDAPGSPRSSSGSSAQKQLRKRIQALEGSLALSEAELAHTREVLTMTNERLTMLLRERSQGDDDGADTPQSREREYLDQLERAHITCLAHQAHNTQLALELQSALKLAAAEASSAR